MIITWGTEEQKLALQASKETGFSTSRILEVVKAIYEANIDEDIKSAIEHLEEVSQ